MIANSNRTFLEQVNDISIDSLIRVARGDQLAMVFQGWYPEAACKKLAQKLESQSWAAYEDPSARGIDTLGEALFNCVGNSIENGCEYWTKAGDYQKNLERLFFPYQHPMSRLKEILDRIWPGGCSTLKTGGKPGFYGLLRRFRNGGEALPHVDNASWDWPCPETVCMGGQLFANLYLARTEFGGDLQMWNRQTPLTHDYNLLRDGQSYGLRRDELGSPDLVIRPSVGTLIIGNARCIHAVTAAYGEGVRVSSSAFLGIGDRLVIFS